jgi:hypothetical protein
VGPADARHRNREGDGFPGGQHTRYRPSALEREPIWVRLEAAAPRGRVRKPGVLKCST